VEIGFQTRCKVAIIKASTAVNGAALKLSALLWSIPNSPASEGHTHVPDQIGEILAALPDGRGKPLP
jgi:hypothetical protein